MNKSLDNLLRLPDDEFKQIFENETLGNIYGCINLVKSMMIDMNRAYKALPENVEKYLKLDMEFLMANLQDKLHILESIKADKQENRTLKFGLPTQTH